MEPGNAIQRLRETGAHIVDDPTELESRRSDRTGTGLPGALAIAEPNSTEQIQSIVRLCRKLRLPLVAQGGLTGYAGGASSVGNCLLLSLRRMSRILSLDPYLPAVTVQAGCITANLQQYALEHGYYFPVDFASAGSSQIGGNVATNAGGIRLIRYGGMRSHVLGLKAVMGNGEILQTNGEVLKDNTGYNLKELLVGSEGTLGIITEVTLALTSPPPETIVLLCGVASVESILDLLALGRKTGLDLHAFEFFDRACMDSVIQYNDLDSVLEGFPWYCLLEFSSGEKATEFMESEELLGICSDALPADSESGKKKFWSYRENISESLSHGPVHKNDISIPLAKIPSYMRDLESLIARDFPDFRKYLFGHIADGNIHINLKPAIAANEPSSHQQQLDEDSTDSDKSDFFAQCRQFDVKNTDLIRKHHGSISAEHGIGLLKKQALRTVKSESEIRWMQQLKRIFDPDGILNPGKIFDPDEPLPGKEFP
ncbi:MAG: FAD-binding oxidoreductase [Spirochaetaceae bacterium]|mgnify:CR=1 FL=1|nr:FAD-binding oxidoreductase [Spirochaetaceae bacterium]|tara:strand:+ start:468 stop:1922 length:1455 start_codon:yes stop_codon:yes gene_type:complete